MISKHRRRWWWWDPGRCESHPSCNHSNIQVTSHSGKEPKSFTHPYIHLWWWWSQDELSHRMMMMSFSNSACCLLFLLLLFLVWFSSLNHGSFSSVGWLVCLFFLVRMFVGLWGISNRMRHAFILFVFFLVHLYIILEFWIAFTYFVLSSVYHLLTVSTVYLCLVF